MRLLQGHSGAVRCLAYSPDSCSLVSGGDDGKVLVWNPQTGQSEEVVGRKSRPRLDPPAPSRPPSPARMRAHTNWIRALAFDTDGRTLATGCWDGRVRLWNLHQDTGRDMLSRDAHSAIWCLAFSIDGLALVAGDMNGQITRTWTKNAGAPHRWAAHQAPVRSLLYTPNGRTLISASHDRTIKLWDADWGLERGTLGEHPDWICCLALAPDGRTLASGCDDGNVRLWDLQGREQVALLPGHEKRICHLAFTRNGQQLFSAGWDGTVRLWDVASRRVRSALDFQVGRVHCVALAPDGMTAATGCDQGVVIWDLDW